MPLSSPNTTYTPKHPEWLKVRAPQPHTTSPTSAIVKKYGLNTVCEEAACPNAGECWSKKHATFMLMGSICTRACRFCNVATGKPLALDPHEPEKIAAAVADLGLSHVVLTSVDRDDLADGGANHFAACIRQLRISSPQTTIEVLTPDFLNKNNAAEIISNASPDVFNHNIETVPSLYRTIRPGARYFNSLQLLSKVKAMKPEIFTKSGIMVGLGEDDQEIYQVMDDLRAANVDFITIGQYLQPTKSHAAIARYVTPDLFDHYRIVAQNKGFLYVASGPLVRSSYHAGDDFKILKERRMKLVNEVYSLNSAF